MAQKTFKFQTFANQISGIDIRKKTLYNIEHKYEMKNDEVSHFCETLYKWRTLNLTNEFVQLDKGLSHVQNLTQLIHKKDTVCKYLISVFDRTTDDSLQALLEIVTSVARDLSEDFYPYFHDVFQYLTQQLQTKNAEKLEWVLKCLAHLFKILKKSIKKDFTSVFQKILPLLATEEHIVNFIAECFAFVTREIGKQKDFLVFILTNVKEEHITGIGRLFFEMIHGVSNSFHLEAKNILTTLYESLFDTSLDRNVLYQIHVQILTDILEMIDKKHWTIFISIFFNNLKKSIETEDNTTLRHYLSLLGQFIEGSKSDVTPEIVENIFKIFDCDVDDEILGIVSKIGSAIILSKYCNTSDIVCSRLTKKVMMIKNRDIVTEFVFATIHTNVFDVIIMPEFIRYIAKCLSQEMLETFSKVLILKKCIEADCDADTPSYVYNNEIISKYIKTVINNPKNEITALITAVLCLPHVTSSVDKSCLSALETLTKETISHLTQETANERLILLLLLLRTRNKLSDTSVIPDCIIIIQKLVTTTSNLTSLQLLSTSLYILKSHEQIPESTTALKSSLCRNLSSHNADIRLFTIKCLSIIDDADFYHIMYDAEQKPVDVFTYREHLVLYDRLKVRAKEDEEMKLSLLHFYLGTLYKNFKLIWEPVMNKIAEISNEIPIVTFWDIFKQQLEHSAKHLSDPMDVDRESDILTEIFDHFKSCDDTYDKSMYRSLLWKALAKFDCCDMKNRDIVEFYMNFYQNEYQQSKGDHDDEDSSETETFNSKVKLLKAHLDVFLALKNPSQINRKSEVCETFKSLITCRSKEVSVSALKCLLKIKYKGLGQDASDTLVELLERKMPEEVTNINKIIPPEQRNDLIEIIMRIVHARLLSRPNKNDRMTYLVQKRKILGFLKNFTKQEINCFFYIAFDLIIQGDARINKKYLSANLKLINLILLEISSCIDDNGINYIINLLMTITRVTESHEYESEIRPKVLGCLCLVFEQFVEFDFTDEISTKIFEIFVDPHLENLSNDCKVSVSALFKLFLEWSKNAKYYHLLEKSNENGHTPLSQVMELLKSDKTSKEVKAVVYGFLSRLVEDTPNSDQGTKLLKKYHNALLIAMKSDIQGNILELDKLDVMPLLQILQEDQNMTEINELVLILLNVLNHKKTSKDTEKVRAILELIASSVHKITNVNEFIQRLSLQFDAITDIENRKLLCKVAKNLLTHNPSGILTCNIIEHFNALDRRWTNQPDYNRRYEAFTLINTYVTEHKWNEDFIHIVFHSSMHILTNDSDIFLRNQTSKYLFLMFNDMNRDLNETRVASLINDLFLPTISVKLKDSKIKCRPECIQLLGLLVSKYPEVNSVLDDFKILSNRNDIEQDFFENITHLQENMQHKAIMKYVKVLQGGEHNFQNQQTLVNYVLPILSFYICNEEYRKKSKIIEVAVMAIAHTAGVLMWKNYDSLLKFYLGKLSKETTFRKQMINICVGILNSFHFKDECKTEEPDKNDKILKSILHNILPSLLKIMNAPSIKLASQGTDAERRDQKYNADRENVLILSLAQALIKLLQKLPKSLFDQHFTSVMYKVTYFLKSNSKAVRIIAKDTLRKILIAVGPSYLEKIINHLASCLQRVNEIHVLTVNVNSLIEVIRPSLKPSHLESVVQVVLQVCLRDIFKPTESYRNGMRMLNRRNEVKPSKKSFLTLEMLAGGISEKCVLDLIGPVKEKLTVAHTHVQVQKIQECFNKIVSGLCKNENITKEALLTLSYGILSESIEELKINKENENNTENNQIQKKNEITGTSLLIPAEPGRKGSVTNKVVKWKSSANASLLTLFGLQILHILLKQKLIVSKQFREYLDLHITTIQKFIESTEVKVKILSLKCITCIWKFQYKSDVLINTEPKIVKNIFEIVRKFVDQTIVRKDENLQLIKSAFKSLIVFIKNVRPGVFNPTQIELMLSYVQNEMENPNENAMAFALLRAIIEKKLQSKTIATLCTKKIANLSVYSEYEWIRNESKLIIQAHIKNYPSKLNQDSYIKFYCEHLRNEVKYLQPSSNIMIQQIVTLVHEEVLNNHWIKILETLTKPLVSPDFESSESQLYNCLNALLTRLSNDQLDNLYKNITESFDSDSINGKRIAAKLCNCLLETKQDFLSKKLNEIIPRILDCLMSQPISNVPGKYVLLNHGSKGDDKIQEKNKFLVADTLTLAMNILDKYPINEKSIDSLYLAKSIITSSDNFFGEKSLKKVKILFTQILGKVLDQTPKEKLMKAFKFNKEVDGVPFVTPHEEIKDILEKLTTEVHMTDSYENLVQGVVNVIFTLTQALSQLHSSESSTKPKGLSFVWMCKVLKELLVKSTPKVEDDVYHSTLVKTKTYDCIERLIETISCENTVILSKAILFCQYKDMTDDKNPEIKERASLVWQQIVKKFKNEPELWTKVQEIYSNARTAYEIEDRKKQKKRKAFDFSNKNKKLRKV